VGEFAVAELDENVSKFKHRVEIDGFGRGWRDRSSRDLH
jgi:hypothetical protein